MIFLHLVTFQFYISFQLLERMGKQKITHKALVANPDSKWCFYNKSQMCYLFSDRIYSKHLLQLFGVSIFLPFPESGLCYWIANCRGIFVVLAFGNRKFYLPFWLEKIFFCYLYSAEKLPFFIILHFCVLPFLLPVFFNTPFYRGCHVFPV